MAKYREHSNRRTQITWRALPAVLLLSVALIQTSTASIIPNIDRGVDAIKFDQRAVAKIANGLPLRVLPIGDSITYGAPDEPFNGYRLPLHAMLTARGNAIDFVGGLRAGAFEDNQNEGHRGKVIDDIYKMSGVGIYAAPNIVLLHAGTNDMNYNKNPDTAPERLSSLMEYIFEHSPNAALFVCQIIPSSTPDILARIKTFNQAVPGVVSDWVQKGKNVTLVDMYSGFDVATDLDKDDNLHPSTAGYAKLAQRYYDAIVAADAKGWIVKAGTSQIPPSRTRRRVDSSVRHERST